MVVGKDNCLYGIHNNSNPIVRFNPVDQQSISFVGGEARDIVCCFGNGALGRDGCIYALTHNGPCLIGDDVGGETSITKWRSELEGPNGAIYCISYSATRVLVIDSFKEFAMGLQTNIKQYPQELGRLFPSSVPSESLASRKSLKSFRIAAFLPVLNVQVHVFHHSWRQRPLKIARCL